MGKARIVDTAVAILLTQQMTGCSVYMAAVGDEKPDTSKVLYNQSHTEVEMTLGPPVRSAPTPDGGLVANYKYVSGNEPSAGRAVAYGFMDLVTLGLWEVVGSPTEMLNQAEKVVTTITYDADGKVNNIVTK